MQNILSLISLEYTKLRSYRPFWVLFTVSMVLLVIIVSSIKIFLSTVELDAFTADNGMAVDLTKLPIFAFPDIWQNITWVVKYFTTIMAFIVFLSITNEYTFKTIRQNIMDGLTRGEYIISKWFNTVIIASLITLVVFITGLILGLVDGMQQGAVGQFYEKIEFVFALLLYTIAKFTFVMFLSIWLRKAVLAIAFFLMYFYFVEPISSGILMYYDLGSISAWLPGNRIGGLIPFPYQRYIFMDMQDYVDLASVLGSIGYIMLFLGLSYWLVKRRDV